MQRRPSVLARTLGSGERVAGADQVGDQPEQRQGEGAGDQPSAQPRFGRPQVEAVGGQQRPGLGAHQRGGEAERQGLAVAPGELSIDGAQHQRHQQWLRQPAGELARPGGERVQQQDQAERRDHAGEGPGEAHARGSEPGGEPGAHPSREHQPPRDAVGERDRRQPAGAGDGEPERRSGVSRRGEDRRHEDRKRLPRGPGFGVELERGQLASPDQPRPGVVDGREGGQQRERGQAADRRRHCDPRREHSLRLGFPNTPRRRRPERHPPR